MTLRIDAEWCYENGAFTSDKWLADLFDHPHTLEEVLTRRDGLWAGVRYYYRIWALTRANVWNHRQRIEWLARLVERAWAHVPHPNPPSVAVIAALRSNCVTKELCDQARCPPHVYYDLTKGKVVSCRDYAALAAADAATAAYLTDKSKQTGRVLAAEDAARSAADSAASAAAVKYGSDCSFAESFAALEYEAQIKDALEILRENP